MHEKTSETPCQNNELFRVIGLRPTGGKKGVKLSSMFFMKSPGIYITPD